MRIRPSGFAPWDMPPGLSRCLNADVLSRGRCGWFGILEQRCGCRQGDKPGGVSHGGWGRLGTACLAVFEGTTTGVDSAPCPQTAGSPGRWASGRISGMPRRARCVLPGVACHATQRGVEGRETFLNDDDRITYLGLLGNHQGTARARLVGWCLIGNHVHLAVVPEQEDSLSTLLRRVHGRYAQDYKARWGRTGHLWQSRFFACPLRPGRLSATLAYVERNPVRASPVSRATDYLWSSAAAHLSGRDVYGLVAAGCANRLRPHRGWACVR